MTTTIGATNSTQNSNDATLMGQVHILKATNPARLPMILVLYSS